jgi:hypothetical protein
MQDLRGEMADLRAKVTDLQAKVTDLQAKAEIDAKVLAKWQMVSLVMCGVFSFIAHKLLV